MKQSVSILRAGPRAAAAAATVLAASTAWIAWSPATLAQTEPGAIADLVERVSPAVVTVLSTQEARSDARGMMPFPFPEDSPFGEFFRRFGPELLPMPPEDREMPRRSGVGSGFVIESDGYIVTNNHVVEGADTVTVRLADEREFGAEVLGTDPQTDLALLKIDTDGLAELDFGDSDALRVGDDVIAVGNPFGLGGTVTRGIVSALGRDINAGPYVDFIQTDASINRGNSGGPLLNLEGEVIGVNSAIYSPTGTWVGVGFAIPSSTAEQIVADLREDGAVERGWLGVAIQPVTDEIAAALGLEEATGALVSDVAPDSPASDTLETGDLILTFNGQEVTASRDLPRIVAETPPGTEAEIEILRGNTRETVSVELGRLDFEQVAAANGSEERGPGALSDRLGATTAPLTAEVRQRLGVESDAEGLVITSLDGEGAAAEAGLTVGDVILRVGNQPVRSNADLEQALESVEGDAALFQIERGGSRLFVGVRIG